MDPSPWNTAEDGQQGRWFTPHREMAEPRPRQLERVIEMDIVPRLIKTQRTEFVGADTASLAPAAPDPALVEEFCKLLAAGVDDRIRQFVELARARGSTLESIYLELLAPAARRLGELWEEDVLHFAEVTLGLMRLHQILRRFSDAFQNEQPYRDHGRRALVASLPGEQHNLGLSMVGEFLHRAGWVISGGPCMKPGDLVRMVREHWFTMVGFSVSSEARLEALRRVIPQVRRASQNRTVRIMVGGKIFTDNPGLVAEVGADTTAPDALQTTLQAEVLLGRMRAGA